MNLRRFNSELRSLFESLISDGFLQKDLSSITFGINRQDQLKSFLEGRDVGGKPLQRIFDELGFELHLVPIYKKDIDSLENVESITNDSLEAMRLLFVGCLENFENKRRKKSNLVTYVDDFIKKNFQREN